MVFVPSIGGVSHSPDERSEAGHLVAGACALFIALRLADAGRPTTTDGRILR
jgi:acetylornithine deacetylase/succinyl-diaminopimelate desuccinylase-like protein